MKKNLLFTAIISLTLASCQSEDSLEQNQSEIQLTSVINPMSRGTSLTQQSTQIASGQEVGITINDAKEPHNNVKWTAEEDGQLINSGTPLYWSNKEVSIYAYHPYNSSWSGTDKLESFSVNTDQSTDAGYLNSDLLWATKTGTKTSNPVELSFTHKLAKINVTLTSEDITDLSNATISICGTKTSTSFNPFTGELSSASNVANIKAGETTKEAYTAAAIIIPQTIVGGTQLIKVTHNNKNFYYKLSDDKEFKSGYSYSYTLKVKEKQVEVDLESGNITDWTDEDATGDAEEDVIAIPNNQIWYTSTDGNVVTPYVTDVFGANIVSNIYEAGKGIITFDGDVTQIGKDAFYDCEMLTNITIPHSVTTIGRQAFGCSGLTCIRIPNSVSKIEERAFYCCYDLEKFTGKYAEDNGICLIVDGVFINFAYACGTTEYSIPNNVTIIGDAAFQNCDALITVIIPDSVTRIGMQAFWMCDGLTEVVIPKNVNKVCAWAFFGCHNLKNVYCKPTLPPSITYSDFLTWVAFTSQDSDRKIYVPTESVEAYKSAEGWSEYADDIVGYDF